MAPRRCCVPSCTVTQADGIPMHRFPNPSNQCKPEELERFRTWVMRIGGDIAGEDDLSIHQNRRVCHRHFEDRFTFPNKRITLSAIPTLHIPDIVEKGILGASHTGCGTHDAAVFERDNAIRVFARHPARTPLRHAFRIQCDNPLKVHHTL